MSDLTCVHRNAAALRRLLSAQRNSQAARADDIAAAELHDEHARCLARHRDLGKHVKLARIAMWRLEAAEMFKTLYTDEQGDLGIDLAPLEGVARD